MTEIQEEIEARRLMTEDLEEELGRLEDVYGTDLVFIVLSKWVDAAGGFREEEEVA